MTQTQVPVRLALRVEGNWWIAYLAKMNSMEDAFELGRILIGIGQNDTCKQLFMDLMSIAVADAIEGRFGQRPDMVQQPAPDHEKGGSA